MTLTNKMNIQSILYIYDTMLRFKEINSKAKLRAEKLDIVDIIPCQININIAKREEVIILMWIFLVIVILINV